MSRTYRYKPNANRRPYVTASLRPGDKRSLIVSYLRQPDGNVICTKLGFGGSRDECLADADSQLRPGVWKRVCISNPASIYSDLVNDGQPSVGWNVRNHKGEGAIVTVSEPRVRERR